MLNTLIEEIDEYKFSCFPETGEMNVTLGLSFYYNELTLKFEIDQNPHGDRTLGVINRIEIPPDMSRMSVDCSYRGVPQTFEIRTNNVTQRRLVKFIAETHGRLCDFYAEDFQSFTYIFKDNKVSIKSNKNCPLNRDDYLNIHGSKRDFFFIRQRPWSREPLNGFGLTESGFIFNFAEEKIEFAFNAERHVVSVARDILLQEFSELPRCA